MAISKKDPLRIVSEMIIDFTQQTQKVTDFNPGSIIRSIFESVATKLDEVYSQLQGVYDATRIDTATGSDLDEIGKLVGVTRKQAQKAVGDVVLVNSAPVGSDVSILAGTQVSARKTDVEYFYQTTATHTFYASITGENHIFDFGIKKYRLGEVMIDSITNIIDSLSNPISNNILFYDNYILKEGTADIVSHASISDYFFQKGSEIVVDNCDSDFGWSSTSEGYVAANNSIFIEGSGSLELNKTSGVSNTVRYYKDVAGFNGNDKNVKLWYYIANPSFITKVRVIMGSSSGDYYYKDFTSFNTGWNLLSMSLETPPNTQGTPNKNNLDYFAIEVEYASPTTEITSGVQMIDDIVIAGSASVDNTEGYLTNDSLLLNGNITYYSLGNFNYKNLKVTFKPVATDITEIVVRYGLDEFNYFEEVIYASEITPGQWNEFYLGTGQRLVSMVGSPSLSALTYFEIEPKTTTTTTTAIKLDSLVLGEATYHKGSVVEILSSLTDGDTFTVDYIPLSTTISVESLEAGSIYNAKRFEVNNLASSVSGLDVISVYNLDDFTGGIDQEDDEDYRERIKFAVEKLSKASVEAIRQNLLEVEYIKDVKIVDRPVYDFTDSIVYISGTNTYVLTQKDPIEILYVKGFVGGVYQDIPYTFDSTNGSITFGGTKPDANSTFQVAYKYAKRGFFSVVYKPTKILTTTEIANINTIIDDTRSAGIDYEVKEALKVPVLINLTIQSTNIKITATEIRDAITEHINKKDIGEGLYVSELIDLVMDLDSGIYNVIVNDPVSDINIDEFSYIVPFNVSINIEDRVV